MIGFLRRYSALSRRYASIHWSIRLRVRSRDRVGAIRIRHQFHLQTVRKTTAVPFLCILCAEEGSPALTAEVFAGVGFSFFMPPGFRSLTMRQTVHR